MEVENRNYQNFINSIFDLASSIVIKSDDAALALNQWVLGYTNVTFDELDRRTWKYYKNICGEYFPSDEEMYVTSLDTLTQIKFSLENLKFHRATKKAYAFGTTYYKELVDSYPDQEQLIRGILYPADMEEAIAAPEGQILAYPENLVEVTEPSLIPKLQEWINGYYRRWHNVQYTNTDNLYLTSMLGVMYSHLPGAIENIRLEACMTHEAHTYHVTEYLASHSKLDKYMPYMTRSQAMFFYHNLAYIENNNGRQEIFEELLKRTFTERNLAMGEFSLKHSTELMPTESLTPLIVFEKRPLNTASNIDNKNQYTLSQVLDIEDELLAGNRIYREEAQPKIVEAATYTLNPNVPTKLLQSTVIDYSDSDKYRFADIVFQHWLWLSYNNLYKAYITFVIPANGAQISLTPLDAFVFYTYAFCKGLGYEMEKLPNVVSKRVQRLPLASIASMREVCEVKYVSDEWLQEARAWMPPATEMISLESFHDHCQSLFVAANQQYALTCIEEGSVARAQKESASARLWCEKQYSLAEYPEQTYAEWFAARNLDIKDLSNIQLLEVSQVILKEATGSNLASTITLKDIQRYMRDLLLDLSSYSIQIALNINTGPVLHAGSTQVRVDNFDYSSSSHSYLEISRIEPRNITTQGFTHAFLDLNKFPATTMPTHSTSTAIAVDISNLNCGLAKKDENGDDICAIRISRRSELGLAYNCIVDMTAPNPRNLTIVPGMEKFLELPLQQQLDSYVDTWAK